MRVQRAVLRPQSTCSKSARDTAWKDITTPLPQPDILQAHPGLWASTAVWQYESQSWWLPGWGKGTQSSSKAGSRGQNPSRSIQLPAFPPPSSSSSALCFLLSRPLFLPLFLFFPSHHFLSSLSSLPYLSHLASISKTPRQPGTYTELWAPP